MAKESRGQRVEVRCIACCSLFKARTADLYRGWARSCSKACAARIREVKARKPEKYARMKRNFEDYIADAIILGEIDVKKKV